MGEGRKEKGEGREGKGKRRAGRGGGRDGEVGETKGREGVHNLRKTTPTSLDGWVLACNTTSRDKTKTTKYTVISCHTLYV